MAVNVGPANVGQVFAIAKCATGQCDPEIYHYQDISIDVDNTNTKIENTPLGTFNDPFTIYFGGSSNWQNSEALTFVGDIRDACGTVKDNINHGTNAGIGILYVFPEIGIIRFDNTCTKTQSNETLIYTATISNTNITF